MPWESRFDCVTDVVFIEKLGLTVGDISLCVSPAEEGQDKRQGHTVFNELNLKELGTLGTSQESTERVAPGFEEDMGLCSGGSRIEGVKEDACRWYLSLDVGDFSWLRLWCSEHGVHQSTSGQAFAKALQHGIERDGSAAVHGPVPIDWENRI
ncbi:hypothetical protein chiPu_0001479 [Chiloscyllium punctatum]|uniref:Uncharacterized protein n=1 Tax=Chiloscyllium punctatum TaxID=137246 RepID=A0A401RY56_CHIPU|nr:hypothetical protein [Chiloscyllium punctatum]